MPGVSCLSIEPSPLTFAKLRRNLGLNPSVHAKLFHLALSSRPELLEIDEISASNSGTTRVHSDDAYASGSERYTIAACTLEEVLAHHDTDKISLLKVDVEGFEFSVLEGLDWSGRHRPRHVLIEFTDYTERFGNGGRRALTDFFADRGYVPRTVDGEPLLPDGMPPEDNAWFSAS